MTDLRIEMQVFDDEDKEMRQRRHHMDEQFQDNMEGTDPDNLSKPETNVNDKEDPGNLAIAQSNYVALYQNDINQLEMMDNELIKEMFDFEIYNIRLQKATTLERSFREDLLQYLYRQCVPNVKFARAK